MDKTMAQGKKEREFKVQSQWNIKACITIRISTLGIYLKYKESITKYYIYFPNSQRNTGETNIYLYVSVLTIVKLILTLPAS